MQLLEIVREQNLISRKISMAQDQSIVEQERELFLCMYAYSTMQILKFEVELQN